MEEEMPEVRNLLWSQVAGDVSETIVSYHDMGRAVDHAIIFKIDEEARHGNLYPITSQELFH